MTLSKFPNLSTEDPYFNNPKLKGNFEKVALKRDSFVLEVRSLKKVF
jgi:hypothetical protein